MYDSGMSYGQIGRALRVEPSTVYQAMRRGAKRNNHQWPLIRHAPRQLDDKTVRADLVVMEIKEFCASQGWTYKDFAREAGVHSSWLYKLTSKHRLRIKETTAKRIMNFIIEREQELEAAA